MTQAKKADVAKKIEQQRQRTAATGIDDAHVPGHRPNKPAIGMKALKQKFKASRTCSPTETSTSGDCDT